MHALVLTAVLVYAPHAKDAAARQTAERALVDALTRAGAETLADDELVERAKAAHQQGWVDEHELDFFVEAERLANEGARALDRVELDQAASLYEKVEQILAEKLRWPGVASRMSEAALQRGVALFELKRTDEAQASFRRAVALDPLAQLTEARVRPDVVRAFRAATAPKPRAQVRLEVVPDGAEARLGAAPPAPAPVDGEVPDGELLVRAEAPGRLPVAKLVPTSAGTIRLALPIDDVAGALDRLATTPPDAVGLRALAQTLGVTDVLVAAVGVDAGAPVIVARRLTPGSCATALLTLHAASIEAAALVAVEKLRASPARDCARLDPMAVLEAPAIAQPRAAVPPGPPTVERRRLRWYEQPWLYAGLLAVTAGTVGLAVGLQPQKTDVHATLNGATFTH